MCWQYFQIANIRIDCCYYWSIKNLPRQFTPRTSKALFAENQIIHDALERRMYLTPIKMLTKMNTLYLQRYHTLQLDRTMDVFDFNFALFCNSEAIIAHIRTKSRYYREKMFYIFITTWCVQHRMISLNEKKKQNKTKNRKEKKRKTNQLKYFNKETWTFPNFLGWR